MSVHHGRVNVQGHPTALQCQKSKSNSNGQVSSLGRIVGINRRVVKVNALDPSVTQDIIIGGAVVACVGAALVLGLQKEPEVCRSCNGSGGVVCFACGGSGVMESDVSPEIKAQARRETLGRNAKKNECRACKGVGRLLCKQCQGSGYS